MAEKVLARGITLEASEQQVVIALQMLLHVLNKGGVQKLATTCETFDTFEREWGLERTPSWHV